MDAGNQRVARVLTLRKRHRGHGDCLDHQLLCSLVSVQEVLNEECDIGRSSVSR